MIFVEKIKRLPFAMIGLIMMIALMGIMMLYSAAGGGMHPWATRQLLRLIVGILLMLWISCIPIRIWITYAYLIYFITLLFLFLVEAMGFVGMGAQRWLDLYFFNFQPSEVMRIALLLALARYFHDKEYDDMLRIKTLIPPLLMIMVPVLLVCRQPDLGTALLLLMGGSAIVFIAGIHWGYILAVSLSTIAAIPVLWNFLHDYQKNRILNFLTPERDPMNTGYHVIQSKIALGSAGFMGKGFLKGTQSHLNFLPEKQTDFIFSMFCEEFGFLGGLLLILAYFLWLFMCFEIVFLSKNRFCQLLGMGLATSFFVYIFVNIAMVIGLLPVVGIPLPFFSYGGTALITLLMSQGILFSIYLHTQERSINKY